MLKLLGRKTSSNVQKVLWCCGELGLAFEREDVGGKFGKNQEPAYLALNPNGRIPTIIDDGFVLWESNVIVRYLSAKYGMGTMCPAELERRADAERWMDWQQTTLGPRMRTLRHALPGPLPDPTLKRTSSETPDSIDPAKLDNLKKDVNAAWKILNAQLAKQPFVAGKNLTMADIPLGNVFHRWYHLPIEHPASDHLKVWYERLRERPAFLQHIFNVG